MHLAHSFQNHPLGFRTQHRKIQALLKRSFFAWDTRLQSVDALYALNTNVRASKKCWRSQLIMLVHLFSNREHTKQLSDSRAYVSPLTRWRSEDRTRIIDEENTRRTEKSCRRSAWVPLYLPTTFRLFYGLPSNNQHGLCFCFGTA